VQTALYRLVRQHLETYLALACEGDGDGNAVPGYMERELRRYLECGILAYGFARAGCPDGGHDFLVAFSCAPLARMDLPAPAKPSAAFTLFAKYGDVLLPALLALLVAGLTLVTPWGWLLPPAVALLVWIVLGGH
jgi:hypothetical protein